ncbi:MAG: hypothetical protein JSU94_16065 [Phycisphaerales bacterium]|nr:MAG: hypothetical protein JSU94_16065 [Phycisphaerales bacterium]
MKKITSSGAWVLLAICAVAIVILVLLERRRALAEKVAEIVSFENEQSIEECIIEVLYEKTGQVGAAPYTRTSVTLRGNDASDFAQEFSMAVRNSCSEIKLRESVALIYRYRISFYERDWLRIFDFDYAPKRCIIGYKLQNPSEPQRTSTYGVIFLRGEAGRELQSLIISELVAD